MDNNSLILIIILGFFALWLVARSCNKEEAFPSGANVRRTIWNQPGPIPWAPALINARAKAEGSPYRVPPDWIPTTTPWEPYATTHSIPRRLKEKAGN